jgi:hypothetical protein
MRKGGTYGTLAALRVKWRIPQPPLLRTPGGGRRREGSLPTAFVGRVEAFSKPQHPADCSEKSGLGGCDLILFVEFGSPRANGCRNLLKLLQRLSGELTLPGFLVGLGQLVVDATFFIEI